MSKQIHDGESDRQSQVKFRAPDHLIERFDAAIDTDSRADAFREFMRETVEGYQAPDAPGDHENLAKALAALRKHASPGTHTIPGDFAKAKIAERTRMKYRNENRQKRDNISRLLLDPLEERGFIEVPVPGTIRLTEKGRGES